MEENKGGKRGLPAQGGITRKNTKGVRRGTRPGMNAMPQQNDAVNIDVTTSNHMVRGSPPIDTSFSRFGDEN